MRLKSFAGLALALPLAAPAADPRLAQAPGDPLCGKCKTTGELPNPAFDENARLLEEGALHCSARIDGDPVGLGAEVLPCTYCANDFLKRKAQATLERRSKGEKEWLEGRRKIDADLKPRQKFVHIETPHFQLTFGLDKVTLPDKTVLNQHRAAHLYANRLEEHYRWLQELLRTSDKEARVTKHQVYLMDDMRTLVAAGNLYAHVSTDRAGRAVGDPSIVVTWRDKSNFGTDASFHQHVVHHVTHNITGVFHMMVWLADDAGWLEEGIAHVAEMDRFNKSGNSCNIEGTEEDMSDGDWQPVVRKMVAMGKTLPFAELMPKRAHLLTEEEHYLAWSYTDYLYRRDPAKLRELVIQIKQKKPQRDAIREVYGLTTTGIDDLWRAYVLETYRVKPAGLR